MIIGSPDEDWLKFFHGRFRYCAHQLLAWGYQDARHKIGADNEEEDITGFIAEAIEDKLNDRATPREYLEHYDIKEEKQVRSRTRTGKRRQRIDIVAVCNIKQSRPEFWFEAKRLKTSVCTIHGYVGDEGMQCYLRGEYAAGYPAAAMVGYMQNSTAKHWLSELQRTLGSDTMLRVKTALRKYRVLGCFPNEWLSEHTRTDGTAISIFHIFLDCT